MIFYYITLHIHILLFTVELVSYWLVSHLKSTLNGSKLYERLIEVGLTALPVKRAGVNLTKVINMSTNAPAAD